MIQSECRRRGGRRTRRGKSVCPHALVQGALIVCVSLERIGYDRDEILSLGKMLGVGARSSERHGTARPATGLVCASVQYTEFTHKNHQQKSAVKALLLVGLLLLLLEIARALERERNRE